MDRLAELAIVIPVHDRRAFTEACLRSLREQTARSFGVIVVDDGSRDGTAEMLRDGFPEVAVIAGDGDLWWSRATNLGVEHALARGAKRIMTLNDDTVAPPGFIETMLRASEREPRALIGALAVDVATGEPVYGGEVDHWLTAKCSPLLDRVPPERRHGLHEVTHFPGRGLLIPAEVFREVGLFAAEEFPQTLADVDFTYRAWRAGHKVYCNYDAPLGIYPAESANVTLRHRKTLRKFGAHLFGIKGGGDLRRFVRFAWRNCPGPYLVPFTVAGVLRRALGYPRDWLREALAS